jgi:hypothetical protein
MWTLRRIEWGGVLLVALAACGGGPGAPEAGRDVDRADVDDAGTPDAVDAFDATGEKDASDAADMTDAGDGGDATDGSDASDASDAGDSGSASDAADAPVDAAKPFFVLAGRYGHLTTDVGDVNGDGKLDLVNSGTDAQVWLGRGDGTFSNTAVVSTLGWTFTSRRYLGHFDKDPGADIATIEVVANNAGFVEHLASGQADGTFHKADWSTGVPMSASWFDVGPGDFTGDGFDDLLFVAGTCGAIGCGSAPLSPTYYVASVSFDSNHGLSNFLTTAGHVQPFPSGGPSSVWATFPGGIGDVDGDGKLDFCLNTDSVKYGGSIGNEEKNGYVVYGKGDGTFEERQPDGGGVPKPITPGMYGPDRLVNLDGDSLADGIIVVNSPGVRWNDGGTFAAAVPLRVDFRAAGDFNGDGLPDLWGSAGLTYTATPGDGQRGFGSPLASVNLTGVSKTIALDIDKDGTIDLVLVDGSTTSIYLSTAKTPFAGPADIQCTCTGPMGF